MQKFDIIRIPPGIYYFSGRSWLWGEVCVDQKKWGWLCLRSNPHYLEFSCIWRNLKSCSKRFDFSVPSTSRQGTRRWRRPRWRRHLDVAEGPPHLRPRRPPTRHQERKLDDLTPQKPHRVEQLWRYVHKKRATSALSKGCTTPYKCVWGVHHGCRENMNRGVSLLNTPLPALARRPSPNFGCMCTPVSYQAPRRRRRWKALAGGRTPCWEP